MTDEQTIKRLRASEMSPGEFLDALEATTEMLIPTPIPTEYTRIATSRDSWRLACAVSWAVWALTLLAACSWGVS